MKSKNKKLLIIAAIILLLLIRKKVSAAELISKFEGIVRDKNDRNKIIAYKDSAGVWTIGYGNTFNPFTGVKVKQGDVIDHKTALQWLNKDIETRQNAIKKLVKVPVTGNQLSALTSLAYNIGLGLFQKSAVLTKLNNKDYKGAADAFLLYNKARDKSGIKVYNAGLDKRRKLERELFLR